MVPTQRLPSTGREIKQLLDNFKMNKETESKIKELYLGEKARIIQSLDASSQSEIDVDGDDCDKVQGAALQLVMQNLSTRDIARLKNITNALTKLEEGKIDECEECGESIGNKRLLAIPGVRLCVICAEDRERQASLGKFN